MHRFRLSLPFLALALLLAFAAPTLADPAAPALDLQLAPPTCEESSPLPELSTEKLFAAFPPPDDFILCTCKTCRTSPETICQISPSGYSILCSDWAATHC